MNYLAITQARIESTRLPKKILKEVNGISLLEIHLRRLQRSKHIDKIVVATTNEVGVESIIKVCEKAGVDYHCGSTDDVLDRFFKTSEQFPSKNILRLTSDCPLIDSELIDQMILSFDSLEIDYMSNSLKETFPDGTDCEIFTKQSLDQAWQNAQQKSEREHVTPYIWKNSDYKGNALFKAKNYSCENDLSEFRITLDQEEDFQVISKLIKDLGIDKNFRDYISYLIANPELRKLNQYIGRNEGYQKSLNQEGK